MFEKASRLKLRFDTTKGLLSVEDLWDLPLTATGPNYRANLDDIARSLHNQLKSDDHISFVEPTRKADESAQIAFEIVKHIITVKIAERDALQVQATNRAKRQKIMELIENKQNETLAGSSVEELRAMLDSLN